MKSICGSVVYLAYSSLTGLAQASPGLLPKKYNALPLGQVKPAGWLKDQISVQTDGLAGHQHEFYNYIAQSTWTGGTASYSNLEEAGSYWFNGIVANAAIADSALLQDVAQSFQDYVLQHAASDGWLGPEAIDTTKERLLWGRYPFFLGLTQVIEAYPDQADTVLDPLYKFVALSNQMLKNGTGIEEWGQARWFEYAITLQWLYDNYPKEQEVLLLETMQLLRSNGVAWEEVFLEKNFPTTATEGLDNPLGNALIWHGVNVAEGLKAGAVAYRFSGNQSDLDSASTGWDLLFKYHGKPSGAFNADEYLAGLDATRGTELCLLVELMYSGSYLFQVTGDTKYADMVERVAYNTLPATLTTNFWSRQYLGQENQIASKNMDPNPFPKDGPYSNVYGLEPNYPCCTVNFPQGYPKFVSHAFATGNDSSSLVHLYLGPLKASTTLADGNTVVVEVDTQYPFSDNIKTSIMADKPFTYYVRVPHWVVNGTISVNGGDATALEPSSGLQAVQVSQGTTTIDLQYPAEISIESRPHNSVAIHRGVLNYAFSIPRNETILKTHEQESRAIDLQFEPTRSWNWALDTSSLEFNKGAVTASLPSPIFDDGLAPFNITVTACPVDWLPAGDLFASPPPQNATCAGQKETIVLQPYGATRLRIGEFPVINQ